jgi:hypothetical protein
MGSWDNFDQPLEPNWGACCGGNHLRDVIAEPMFMTEVKSVSAQKCGFRSFGGLDDKIYSTNNVRGSHTISKRYNATSSGLTIYDNLDYNDSCSYVAFANADRRFTLTGACGLAEVRDLIATGRGTRRYNTAGDHSVRTEDYNLGSITPSPYYGFSDYVRNFRPGGVILDNFSSNTPSWRVTSSTKAYKTYDKSLSDANTQNEEHQRIDNDLSDEVTDKMLLDFAAEHYSDYAPAGSVLAVYLAAAGRGSSNSVTLQVGKFRACTLDDLFDLHPTNLTDRPLVVGTLKWTLEDVDADNRTVGILDEGRVYYDGEGPDDTAWHDVGLPVNRGHKTQLTSTWTRER